MPALIPLWKKMSAVPGGKIVFSRMVCMKAPYFASIRPLVTHLDAERCELRISKRRAVLNHIGTVHAIAMCNMAELAAGIMTEATVPGTHRWIPKGMSVEYLKKAGSDLRAVAELAEVPVFGAAGELPVPVSVTDRQGEEVFRAVIRMWISPRKVDRRT